MAKSPKPKVTEAAVVAASNVEAINAVLTAHGPVVIEKPKISPEHDLRGMAAESMREIDSLRAYIAFLHKNYPNKLVSYEQWKKKAK